ncbi:hypothetical protein Tco_0843954 [Tanacetum coccineum]
MLPFRCVVLNFGGVTQRSHVEVMKSPFQPKLLHSSEHKPKLRYTKDFEAKYNKVKAKLALLSSSASSPKSSSGKNKGLIAKSYKWNEEEVSSDENEAIKVKALMTLANEERVSVSKENASNKTWLNSSNKVNQCISEQIPTQKKKILGIDQLTKDTFSSGPKVPVFVKSLTDNSEVSITDSKKPKLFEAKDSTLSNHDTDKHPLPPLEKLVGAKPVPRPKTIESNLKSNPTFKAETLKGITLKEPSSAPAKDNKKGSSASKTSSAPTGKKKNMKVEDDPPLAIAMKELNELKLQLSKKKLSHFRNYQPQQTSQHHTGQGEFSIRSRPFRPVISFPSCIHCRKGEAKKAGVNKTTSSNVPRSKTPTQRLLAQKWEVPRPEGIYGDDSTYTTEGHGHVKLWYFNQQRYVRDLLKKYDKIGSLVTTPMVPPNMLGPDLNDKALNETQYRGMIGSLMNLTASRPDIQFSICLYARHQANIRNPTLLIKESVKEQKRIEESVKVDLAKQEIEIGKMLNRKVQSRITNPNVLTRKGPITLKVYREDGTDEVIPNFKASDLHLSDWERYGYIKNYKKTVKNGQARTRESEEYKKKPKNQSRSQKSQASVKSSQTMVNSSQPLK